MNIDFLADKILIEAALKERGESYYTDYIIMIFTADVYGRYLEELTGKDDVVDNKLLKVIRIIRASQEQIDNFVRTKIAPQLTSGMLSLLDRALKKPSNYNGIRLRAQTLRSVFNRTPTMKLRTAFATPRDYQMSSKAAEASGSEDEKTAMNVIGDLTIRTPVVKMMIQKLVTGVTEEKMQVSVEKSIPTTQSEANKLSEVVKQKEVTSADTPEFKKLQEKEDKITENIKAISKNSTDHDEPATKGDALAIATTVAAHDKEVKAFRDLAQQPDPEQRSAIMTSGKVLVAAGAGAGKTKTLSTKVAYLIKDKNVDPSSIFVTTFTTNAADEMKKRIEGMIGEDAVKNMTIGTFHSFSLNMLKDYGSGAYQKAIRNSMNMDFKRFPTTLIRMSIDEYEDNNGKSGVSPKEAQLQISNWKYDRITPDKVNEWIRDNPVDDPDASKKILATAQIYAIYETLKGREKLENKPPYYSEDEASRGWFGRKRYIKESPLIDFDDMQSDFLTLLEKDSKLREYLQKKFSHIIMDEAQDSNSVQLKLFNIMTEKIDETGDAWLVGDLDQCVEKNTMILTPDGEKPVFEIKEGEEVLGYRNGKIVPQIVQKMCKTDWIFGYKITTTSGKTLTMSPNHKIWATNLILEPEKLYVYLMYRPDLGFRVGTSKSRYSLVNNNNSFRGQQEDAERLWLLDVCDNKEEAILCEESYSLKYAVPTWVFKGEERGINQDRINRLFEKFGDNGRKILEDKFYNFDLPHWRSCGYDNGRIVRRVISLIAHSSKGSNARLEWTGNEFDEILSKEKIIFHVEDNNRRRIRKYSNDYREILKFIQNLQILTGAFLDEKICIFDESPRLLTASSLFPTMKVIVNNNGEEDLEEITKIEKVDGEFYDLDVFDCSNFFGNGILSHNSLYSFRGAKPDAFLAISEDPKWKVKKIRTNYRCNPEIINSANKLISHNTKRIPMEALPNRKEKAGIEVRRDEIENLAGDSISYVKGILNSNTGEKPSDFAVLARTNNELHDFEAACIVRGVPYTRKGGSNFFNRKEVKAITDYITLATSNDVKAQNEALINIYDYPSRFLGGKFKKFLEEDRSNRPYIDLLDDGEFQDLFGRQSQNVGKLYNDIMGLRQSAKSLSTHDLIMQIMELEGEKGKIRDYVERDSKDEEAESAGMATESATEEKKQPSFGGISYLLKMTEPDPTEPLTDPQKPEQFLKKIDNLKVMAKKLKSDKGVVLSTIHGAKGLEWKNVFGVMQNPRTDVSEEGLEEERRMAYVQVTRARDNYTVLSPMHDQRGRVATTSRFIAEAGLDQYARESEKESSYKGALKTANHFAIEQAMRLL